MNSQHRHRSRATPVCAICVPPTLIPTTAHQFILETILAERQGFVVL